LLGQLQKDGIERRQIASTELYETWMARRKADAELVSLKPEPVLSNWFEVVSLPEDLNFYSSGSLRADWEAAAQALKVPKRYENGILCTFANDQHVRMSLPLGIKIKRLKKIKPADFLAGEPSAPLFSSQADATRAMVDLVRQGFSILAESRGLEQHSLANRTCWFPKLSSVKDERIKFDADGFAGSRQLLGRHKEFFWHYATSIDLAWTRPIRVTASGHVLFSQDGEKILGDVAVAAKLRRKALRSKRNAWWRM
jgi:hypothetical protein